MIRIIKVKVFKEGKLFIHYQKETDNQGWDDYTMDSSESPSPSLYDAMNNLRQSVIELCEFADSDLEKILIRGVTFSWANDVMGATITAQRKLAKSNMNLNINTPHKVSKFYSCGDVGDNKQLLSTATIDILNDIRYEVEKYINGERAQMGLFAATS